MDREQETIGFTVYFDDPFWVGVLEAVSRGKLSACKITFGAEPKEYEVHSFLLQNFYKLKLSPPVEAGIRAVHRNPKRMQRAVRKQVQETGIGTKSQQALKLQQEEKKAEHKTRSKERRSLEKQQRFEEKQMKKKEKHRGR